MDVMTLKERTKWVIDRVIEDRGLSNEKLAEIMGVSEGTINNYRTMKRTAPHGFIVQFCASFGYDEIWFHTGNGEPFPGASEKYPFVFFNSSSPFKKPKSSQEGGDDVRAFRVSDDLTMAARILEAKSPYSTALHLNILAFDRAMSAEQRISQVEHRITSSEEQLRRQMDELTARLQELETRNAELECTIHPPEKPEPPEGENPETS